MKKGSSIENYQKPVRRNTGTCRNSCWSNCRRWLVLLDNIPVKTSVQKNATA